MSYVITANDNPIQILEVTDLYNELENKKIVSNVQDKISNGFNRVVLDLGKLSFMNSIGINFLIALRRESQNAGGDLTLVNPSTQVIELLEITKLKSFFRFSHTIDEAMNFLND